MICDHLQMKWTAVIRDSAASWIQKSPTEKWKKASINVHRNQLWWSSCDGCFLVSMKEKKFCKKASRKCIFYSSALRQNIRIFCLIQITFLISFGKCEAEEAATGGVLERNFFEKLFLKIQLQNTCFGVSFSIKLHASALQLY